MKALRDQRYLLWLLLPLALYLVPLALGYAWNSLLGPNVLNPPEGYVGRLPSIPITAESWGTAVVVVPFHARLGEFLRTLTLPLWNPYQGLGQPFAAQGEGSPYFPLAIIRALLPYSWSNWVTVGMFGLAGLFVTSFLRGLGLTARTAVFGGIAFTISGAVIPHVPRDNIADQLCLAPILFWATAAAVRGRTARRFAALAVVSGLHVLAGFVQIAMLATVLAILLALVLATEEAPSRWVGLGRAIAVNGAIGVGTALVAFYLLPMFETMASSHSQNLRLVSCRWYSATRSCRPGSRPACSTRARCRMTGTICSRSPGCCRCCWYSAVSRRGAGDPRMSG